MEISRSSSKLEAEEALNIELQRKSKELQVFKPFIHGACARTCFECCCMIEKWLDVVLEPHT